MDPSNLGRDWRFSIDDADGMMRGLQPRDAVAEQVHKISAATEDWCARAAAQGEGYRLFRSDVRYEHDVTGHRAVVNFQILEPGEGAPASGMVLGPWPGHHAADQRSKPQPPPRLVGQKRERVSEGTVVDGVLHLHD